MNSALIVVDIQKDFMPGGSLSIPLADEIIPGINHIMRMFSLVVGTKDYHPKKHISFASTHIGKKPGDHIEIEGGTQILWPDHCIQGSQGSEFDSRLDKECFLHIVLKGTHKNIDSYSTFFDNARDHSTGLSDFLFKQDIHKVFLCGVATEYCVLFSTIDALDLGFEVFVIKDLCRPVELLKGDEKLALKKMEVRGAKLIDSSEVASFL